MINFAVTKDSGNWGINNDYNVVSNDGLQRAFVARKLTYDQANQLMQECKVAHKVTDTLKGEWMKTSRNN